MSRYTTISNTDNVIDSRDIIKRIEELESELQDAYDDYFDSIQTEYDDYLEDFEVRIEEQYNQYAEDDEDIEDFETWKSDENNYKPMSFEEWAADTSVEKLDFEDWLTAQREEGQEFTEEAQELKALKDLADEAEYSPDWKYGETLIHEDYFTKYAEELASDCCEMPRNLKWPFRHIDWDAAAEELKQDYTEVDFDGETYYIRS